MFNQEFKVKGKSVNGQIIGHWSTQSYFAFKLKEVSPLTLGEKDLEELIQELQEIKDKVQQMNLDHAASK
ncbi:hypothetical protein [Bacillus infantis]|uniref:hypothetical protein n=1 Tax=Bacillus infantis TaxID=324767 RepID=UPI003CF4FB78